MITQTAGKAHRTERIASALLMAAAGFVVLSMAALLVYLGYEGLKTFLVDHVSPLEFLFSPTFNPETGHAGSLVYIVGSISITAFAILVGGPFGVAVAIFLSQLAPVRFANALRPAIELLVGIPSVVYGWLGLTLLVPFIRNHTGSSGYGLLAAGIVLSIMILPTVISLSEDALRSVPGALREGSLALGATRWQTIHRVLLPAARSGIMVAIILGTARAIGETMAVQMVIGNSTILPQGLLSPTSALPTAIVLDMSSAPQGSLLQHSLFSMALLLLLIAMGFILAVRLTLRSRNG